ncbi:MAG: hypothetical protein GC165_13055 [Armatimonadetes bacterium]|nr:hypothetical protein [Armatimonadota bacterium]
MSSRSFGRVVVTEVGLAPNTTRQIPIELYGTIDSKTAFGGNFPGEWGLQAAGIWRVCNELINEAESLSQENQNLKACTASIKELEQWLTQNKDRFPSGPENSQFGPALDKVIQTLKQIRTNMGDSS